MPDNAPQPLATFRFDLYVHHASDPSPVLALEKLMSIIGDRLDQVKKAVDDAVARVTAHIDDLKKQVADLQAKVDQGTATPEELARLDALQAKVAGLDLKNPATLPGDQGQDQGTNPEPGPVPTPDQDQDQPTDQTNQTDVTDHADNANPPA